LVLPGGFRGTGRFFGTGRFLGTVPGGSGIFCLTRRLCGSGGIGRPFFFRGSGGFRCLSPCPVFPRLFDGVNKQGLIQVIAWGCLGSRRVSGDGGGNGAVYDRVGSWTDRGPFFGGY
jgi:hypothetical protein